MQHTFSKSLQSIDEIVSDFTQKELIILKAMTKHSLLNTIAISFYNIEIIALVTTSIIEYTNTMELKTMQNTVVLFYWLFTGARLIQILCVCLTFSFWGKWYILICKPFHSCCYGLCKICVGYGLDKHMEEKEKAEDAESPNQYVD